MTKDPDKQNDVSAGNLVRGGHKGKDVATPGRVTLPVTGGIDDFAKPGQCTRAPGLGGCFLDDNERRERLGDMRANLTSAATNFKIACTEAKFELLMQKQDLHWIAALVLDLAGNFLIGEATRAILRVRAKHLKAVTDAAHNGSDAPRLSERIAAISEDTIKQRVKGSGAFVTKQGKALITTASKASAAAKKSAQLGFLAQLENDVDVNYRAFYLDTRLNATDAELLVLQEGTLPQYHKPDDYKQALAAMLDRFVKSGVPEIGRRTLEAGPLDEIEHAGKIEDRRVVWVNVGGERQLFFQHHYAGDNPNTIKPGEPLYSNINPDHKPRFAEREGETKIGKPVPRELWDVAIAASEARWGITPLLLLSRAKVHELTGHAGPDNTTAQAMPASPVKTDTRGSYGPQDLSADLGSSPSKTDTRGGGGSYDPRDLADDLGISR